MTDWAQACVVWSLRGVVLGAAVVFVLAVVWPGCRPAGKRARR